MAIYLIGKLFASVKYQNQFKNDEANVMGTSLFKIFKYIYFNIPPYFEVLKLCIKYEI